LIGLDRRALLDQDAGAVDHLVAFALAAFLVEDGDAAGTVHGDDLVLLVAHRADFQVLGIAVVLGVLLVLLGAGGGRTADVEGAHRQLSAGLADGLGGDDADGFALLDEAASGEISPVAELADAALGFAGEHGADLDAVDASVLNGRGQLLGDLLIGGDQQVALVVADVLERDAADDAVAQRLDGFARLDDRLDEDAVGGAAIGLAHDDVLGDI